MLERYRKVVEWSEDDAEYIALSPDFPGASGSGETELDALVQLKESIEVLAETYIERGQPLPEARKRESHSGQIRLRMPKTLHEKAAREAELEGVSLNQYLLSIVAAGVANTSITSSVERILSSAHEVGAVRTQISAAGTFSFSPDRSKQDNVRTLH